MTTAVPALAQLRFFEAAARHGSFTRAADELCLTPSAVSHQLRALEVALGVTLFDRAGRRMVLTEAGRRYLEEIAPAFERIGAATARLLRDGRDVLTVGVAPSFAAACLLPNLAAFLRAHPNLDVRLVTYDHQPSGAGRDVDCEIRYGHGKWHGAEVTRLARDALLPLCSPEVARHAAKTGGAFPDTVLLIETESRRFGWDAWFRARDAVPPAGPRLRVDRSPLAIKAAANGVGVALESRILAARELAEGSLVPLPDVRAMPAEEGYFLVRPRVRPVPARVAAFAGWLVRDLARTITHASSPAVSARPAAARRALAAAAAAR
jgi:LysR family glycine cleavage system transcriptional activator